MKPYYQDNAVTIYHGDCRAILPTLSPVDLVLTDPPYGVNLDYTEAIDDSFENWMSLMCFLIPSATRMSKTLLLSTSKLEGEIFLFRNFPPLWRVCWYKGASCTRSAIGFKDWETVFVYGERPKIATHDYFEAHANFVRDEVPGHPCPKPNKWASWLISKFSTSGESILDPFMGSGTTLRAAKDLGRKAIGIEICEAYCEIAAKRMSQEVFDFKATDSAKAQTNE